MPPQTTTNPKLIPRDQVNVIIQNGKSKGLTGQQVLDGLVKRGYEPEGVDVIAARNAIAAQDAAANAPKQSKLAETAGDVVGIGKDIVDSVKKRAETIAGVTKDVNSGKISPIRGGFDTAGQIAGGAADAIGAVFKGAGNVLLNDKHEKDVTALIHKFGAKVVAIPEVQDIMNKYNALTPEQQRDIDSGGGIVNLVTNFIGGKAATEAGSAVKQGAEDIAAGAKNAVVNAGEAVVKGTGKIAGEIIPTADRIVNHQVTKALDLTAGDVKNISQSTGNEVGQFLADKNLIAGTKDDTVKMVKDFYDQNYKVVREEIGKVTKQYAPVSVPRYTEALKQIQKQITGVAGLQGSEVEVANLLAKKGKTITLNDVQRVKELLDDHFNLYKATGDVKEGVAKEGLANVRSDLKNFIEKEVKKNTGADIQELNNNVATSRSIMDAVEERSTRGLTQSNLKLGDLGVFGVGSTLGSPFLGVAAVMAKKIIESPGIRLKIAKFLDGISDASKARIKANLEKGAMPKEIINIIDEPAKDTVVGAAKNNLKNKAKSQAGFISMGGKDETVAGVAKSVAKKMHKDDISLMQKFIDYARVGNDLSDNEFMMVEKLAQKLKISLDKGLKGVANDFEDILTGKKKA